MKLAIMQPYFFPYLGYWQLINHVDEFIIYDDVNFIKGGYINRNNILTNTGPKLISLELNGASSFKKINEVGVGNNKRKLVKTIKQNYTKAPFFNEVFPIIERALINEEKNLSLYLFDIIKIVCEYLGIETIIQFSSEINKNTILAGEEKVIDICKMKNTSEYINSIGGKELYSHKNFMNNGVELAFLKSNSIVYSQFEDEFHSNLSIIDVLMFNSIEDVKYLLSQYNIER
jgi:hypothetical protein